MNSATGESRIRVGVSACLLGHYVRYDGGHKREPFLTDVLSRFVEFVPVCPEVELGLGVPRETVRLTRRGREVRLIASQSETDHTDAMRQYSERRVDGLGPENLSGYIFKMNSPSCGIGGVSVVGQRKPGRGLFAEALMCRWPNLPVEDEGRLGDPRTRENFIERVFAYRRLRCFIASRWSRADLRHFHAAHELQLQVHSPTAYARLKHLIDEQIDRRELQSQYEAGYMRALSFAATPARHLRILERIQERMRPHLESATLDELIATIAEYRASIVPLTVPIVLIHQLAVRFEIDELMAQTYLEFCPAELLERCGHN